MLPNERRDARSVRPSPSKITRQVLHQILQRCDFNDNGRTDRASLQGNVTMSDDGRTDSLRLSRTFL